MSPYTQTIYGPHKEKRGRKHVYIVMPDGTRKHIQYHRYLLEVHLGRFLTDDEVAHHKNGDPTDNRIENLEALTRREHEILHGKVRKDYIGCQFHCPSCFNLFTLSREQMRAREKNARHGTATKGPYCSPSCAAKDRLNNFGKLNLRSSV